ncbi:MAG: hypothetical protein EPN41_03345 [Candidimonas sp.]|nr:MAG: hypothetical protein EPN41_03345 [Candidimonas sp.]
MTPTPESPITDFVWHQPQRWSIAVALSERLRLPMAALFDEHGHCLHAFVTSKDGAWGLDIRGWQRVDDLKRGCAGQNVRHYSRGEIEAPRGPLARPVDSLEIRLALRTAKAHGLLRQEPPRTDATA